MLISYALFKIDVLDARICYDGNCFDTDVPFPRKL